MRKKPAQQQKTVKVNPSYLYEGSYTQGTSMPKGRQAAIVLFVAAGLVILIAVTTALNGAIVDSASRAVESALSVLFLVGGVCCWVMGGK